MVTGLSVVNDPYTWLYRNDGDSTFTEVKDTGLPDLGNSSVAWGDYNADGWPDLLLSGDAGAGGQTMVYRNNGNGTFTGDRRQPMA